MPRSSFIVRTALVLACLLICKTTLAIVLGYSNYFPPNFRADFLLGRSSYFFGAYRWAFYMHILSGPVTLFAGLVLLSNLFRSRFPAWHRRIGRVQVALVLLLVTPSGLWMSWYAATGQVAGMGFAVLSVATAVCAILGWRAAVSRRFQHHQRWMQRCYALLCSAVVLRVIGGLSEVLQIEWTYPYAAWVSWLGPIIALEFWRQLNRRSTRLQQW